ncbi:MAG: tetratricopeptide repeat protein [Candidatus Obscuribacterales bacterium]|nr:tetratricopeptide repeat protein [Candidatus Obscuribacterales bacterium]
MVESLERGLSSPAEQAYLQGLRSQKGEAQGDPLTCFDRAIALDGSQSSYYRSRAGVFTSGESYEKALSDYNKAISLSPEWSYLYYERGLCECSLERFDAALSDFSTAIGQRSNNSQFYSGRALALLATGKPEEALQSINKALELTPNDCLMRYQKGLILSRLERHDAAVDEFSKTEAFTCVTRGDVQQKVFFDGEREYQLCKGRVLPEIIKNWRRPIAIDYYRENNKFTSS